MIGYMSLRIGLCLLIASGFSAAAQKYPNTADDDLPRNTIGGEYRVMERTPVYRSRVSGERAFFYLPKNSRVEILGKFEGWGVFSVYTPERFKTLLTEAVPDEKTQYGWVRLEQLRRTDSPKKPCPDVPPASSIDDYFDCAGEYDTVSATNVVVFLWGYRYVGNTYRSLGQSRLNQCIKTCRDEPKCVGFFYSASQASCELKDAGEVDLNFTTAKDPPFPNFSGMKLVD
jgi:PAN domain